MLIFNEKCPFLNFLTPPPKKYFFLKKCSLWNPMGWRENWKRKKGGEVKNFFDPLPPCLWSEMEMEKILIWNECDFDLKWIWIWSEMDVYFISNECVFATAPTVSAVAKGPHFFFSFFFFFVGPLLDWSGQTLHFSHWSTQTEGSTHACSSHKRSCVAHCTHLSADGLSTWYKWSLVVAVSNQLIT